MKTGEDRMGGGRSGGAAANIELPEVILGGESIDRQ